jgi:hypothetical protein
MKQNCWEFKKCGREPGGKNAAELGVCPVGEYKPLDGTHQGKNAGRACWVLAGTLCGGKVQGTFAQKYSNCKICDFYKTVKKEENGTYQMSVVLLNKINSSAKSSDS